MNKFFLFLVAMFFVFSCSSSGNDNNNTDTVNNDTVEHPDQVSQNDTVNDTTSTSGCEKCDNMKGWAFRINMLNVQKPDVEGLKNFLNDRWSRDIEKGVLNIVFEIIDYDKDNGKFDVWVGPGWKDSDGDFYILDNYKEKFELSINDNCEFASLNLENLYFHAGALDAPVNCAPELTQVNAIPLKGLSASGILTTDCKTGSAGFDKGWLSGCVPKDAAYKICSCSNWDKAKQAYVCDTTPNPDGANYCRKTCGDDANWADFGYFVDKVIQLPTDDECMTNTGVSGYLIEGVFTAERILNYKPVKAE